MSKVHSVAQRYNYLSMPRYGRANIELFRYFEEKRAMGLVDLIFDEISADGRHHFQLPAGAYREVIEPWLRKYAIDFGIVCHVHSRCRSIPKVLSRSVLLQLKSDSIISVWIEVLASTKRKGVFEYVEPAV